ncbi:hypothetical protein QOZ80_9BG0698140 [Eleusine coracana subsp. coracana]|nr:hypothetical protein QOZ80_9BG0698140 [Eleusine coracana subsp. coracana]
MSRQGLAFVVAPSKNFSDALPNQYLGLTNMVKNNKTTNHFLAIELDTVENMEFNDIDSNHVGIDINGLNSIQSHSVGYYDDMNGSFHKMSLNSGEAMQVWLEYCGESKQINVTMGSLEMEKPVRPLISTTYDLSTVIQESAYVGFSASTDEIDTRHCVLGWSFSMNRPAQKINISKLPKLPRNSPKPQSKLLDIILPIATASFIIVLGAAIILLIKRKWRYAELKEYWEVEFGPHRLSYKDLYHATEGFHDKYLLGAGGFGKAKRRTLNWEQRFHIIKGIASGLLYLHEKWEKVVIHRDIKASNVLIDSEMNGHLGDFGLARLYDHGTDLQTTHVVGTMGYIAPELLLTGKASPLTDVFAFGTFLLEVVCGQRPVNHKTEDGQAILADWVLEHWRKDLLTKTVDMRLRGHVVP